MKKEEEEEEQQEEEMEHRPEKRLRRNYLINDVSYGYLPFHSYVLFLSKTFHELAFEPFILLLINMVDPRN